MTRLVDFRYIDWQFNFQTETLNGNNKVISSLHIVVRPESVLIRPCDTVVFISHIHEMPHKFYFVKL